MFPFILHISRTLNNWNIFTYNCPFLFTKIMLLKKSTYDIILLIGNKKVNQTFEKI